MHHPLICVRDVCTLLSHFILLFPSQTQKTAFMSADLENVFFSVSYMCVHVKTKQKILSPVTITKHVTVYKTISYVFICSFLSIELEYLKRK
jgi:hypothetical protein